MGESGFSSKKRRPICKQIFSVFTVLCALGGVMYVTGFGKQIADVIDQMITTNHKPQLQKRRYDLQSFQTLFLLGKYFVINILI